MLSVVKKFFFRIKEFIINKIKIFILILLFGDEYRKVIQDNKEEKLSSLIVYPNFRDFKFEAEYGWNYLNNEKIHDSFESGVRFKILMDSCEIMNFFTVREFMDFILVLSKSLNEQKSKFFFYKKFEKNLENINHYLTRLFWIKKDWDDTSYNFQSEEDLTKFNLNLINFFNSRFEMYYFLFKSIPSHDIILYDLIDFDYFDRKTGEYGVEIMNYDKKYYFSFIENYEIFINGLLNFPFIWKKKESIFIKILNFLFKLIIRIKYYKFLFKSKFSDYKFSMFFLIKLSVFFVFFIFYTTLVILNLNFYFWVLVIYLLLLNKINKVINFENNSKIYFLNKKDKLRSFYLKNKLKIIIYSFIFSLSFFLFIKIEDITNLNLINKKFFLFNEFIIKKNMFPSKSSQICLGEGCKNLDYIHSSLFRSSSFFLGGILLDSLKIKNKFSVENPLSFSIYDSGGFGSLSKNILKTPQNNLFGFKSYHYGDLKILLQLNSELKTYLELWDSKNLILLSKYKPSNSLLQFLGGGYFDRDKKNSFLWDDLSKNRSWETSYELFSLLELNKNHKLLKESGQSRNFRRLTAEEQIKLFQNFRKNENSSLLTPDACYVSSSLLKINEQKDGLSGLIEMKKISYPFNSNFLRNFFLTNETKIKYPNSLNLPTSIIINIGELNMNDREIFFSFLEKKILEGNLSECFYLNKESKELVVTDLKNFSSLILEYFHSNNNYSQLLKTVENLSMQYSSIFDKIYKDIYNQSLNKKKGGYFDPSYVQKEIDFLKKEIDLSFGSNKLLISEISDCLTSNIPLIKDF